MFIAAAHAARTAGGDAIDPGSDVSVAFRGRASVTIPPGIAVLSDAVEVSCPSLSEITVSLYIESAPAAVTGHPGSRTTSYLISGDHVAARRLPGAASTEHW